MAMERRVAMGAGRVLGMVAVLSAGVCFGASSPAGRDAASHVSTALQTFNQDSSSSSHKHHVTVAEEEGPDPDLTQAEAFIQKQNLIDAEPLLRKVVGKDPSNYVAWFDLGFVENALGKVDQSIAAYRKSVAAKPDVFESNLNLGLQLAKSGQPDAEQYLRAATQLKPTSHVAEGQERAWLSLGHVLEQKAAAPNTASSAAEKRPSIDDAIDAYQHASALQPKDLEPHLAAGQLFESENKFADAEQEYKAALAIDPRSSDAITGLANIYMRGRRFPEAEAELRRIVAAHPEETAAHIELGRVLAAEGKNDDAITELQAAQKNAPADNSLERDLADLYSAAGKNTEAEAAYRALIAKNPNDAELHHGLAQSLMREKRYADAQQELLTCLKLKPEMGIAYGDLAFAASENKNYPLAIKALDVRAKLLPEIPITYFLRASAYDHLQNVKLAIENYQKFLEAANGKYPEQEWQAKHRLIALEPKK